MKFIPVLLLTFLSASVSAQYKFRSFTTVGLIAGESTPALEIQTINGVKYKRFFLGAGIGKDDYYYKSLPLFADARLFITEDQNAFIYGDLGYNFNLKNKPKDIYSGNYDFRGGLYTGFGLGFQTKLIHKSNLVITFGHSLKNVTLIERFGSRCVGCTPDYYQYRYKLNRGVLKAGIGF